MGIEFDQLNALIEASYSVDDFEFAAYPQNTLSARDSLLQAAKQDVGFNQFLRLHREFLESKYCFDEHIEEQLEKVRDITSYFDSN
jgi:hypothetical protein